MKTQFLLLIIVCLSLGISAQETAPVKLFADKTKSTITYAMDHLLHSYFNR